MPFQPFNTLSFKLFPMSFKDSSSWFKHLVLCSYQWRQKQKVEMHSFIAINLTNKARKQVQTENPLGAQATSYYFFFLVLMIIFFLICLNSFYAVTVHTRQSTGWCPKYSCSVEQKHYSLSLKSHKPYILNQFNGMNSCLLTNIFPVTTHVIYLLVWHFKEFFFVKTQAFLWMRNSE